MPVFTTGMLASKGSKYHRMVKIQVIHEDEEVKLIALCNETGIPFPGHAKSIPVSEFDRAKRKHKDELNFAKWALRQVWLAPVQGG